MLPVWRYGGGNSGGGGASADGGVESKMLQNDWTSFEEQSKCLSFYTALRRLKSKSVTKSVTDRWTDGPMDRHMLL